MPVHEGIVRFWLLLRYRVPSHCLVDHLQLSQQEGDTQQVKPTMLEATMDLNHRFFHMLQTPRRLHTSASRDFDASHPRYAVQREFISSFLVAHAENPLVSICLVFYIKSLLPPDPTTLSKYHVVNQQCQIKHTFCNPNNIF